MKKKHGAFLRLVVLLMAMIFTLAGCATNRNNGDDDPELAKWAGTWNNLTAYFDDTEISAAIQAKATATSKSVDEIKKTLKVKRGTAFVSCKISGDAITFYNGKDAAGASQTVTYTYKGEIPVGVGDMNWFSFEGDAAAGKYKYLLLLPAEDDEGEAPFHFHCLYGSSSFEALTGAGFDWFPQMIRQDQATAKIKGEIEGLLEEM